MVKRGPRLRPQASEGEAQHGLSEHAPTISAKVTCRVPKDRGRVASLRLGAVRRCLGARFSPRATWPAPITASQPPARACNKHYRSRLARPLFFKPCTHKSRLSADRWLIFAKAPTRSLAAANPPRSRTVAHTVARHLAGITGTNRCDRAFNRQEHLCPASQSRDWSAPHSWCFWVSQPCPRSRRLRAPPPSRGNKHSTTHAGPATRPRKATIAWVLTSTILSEGKQVPSRTTAIPAP